MPTYPSPTTPQDDAAPSIATHPAALVVDDDPGICAILTRFLQRTCLTVEAYNAAAALQWLERSRHNPTPIGVALVDIMMPGLDGLSLCQMIHTQYQVPVVICTARNSRADVDEAVRRGASDYILKPFTQESVIRKVSRWVRRETPALPIHAAIRAALHSRHTG